MLKLILSFFLFISTLSYADSNPDHLLFTIKLYFEPKNHMTNLSYHITLPVNDYYSSYLGSDLPSWRVVKKNKLQGNFKPVELVNIRIHGNQPGLVSVTITDVDHSRIIWQGRLTYNIPTHKILVVTKFDNTKYYETKITTDREPKTVWVESADK
jgi:hypothetical protein